MEKEELLDLDNLELPIEELSNEELKQIKYRVKDALKDYKSLNSEINEKNLDLKKLDYKAIEDFKNDTYINLAENTVILKGLVLGAIDKEIVSQGQVIYKDLLRPSAMSARTGYWTLGTPFYYYIVLLKEKVIIYKLDNHFRVVENNKYKIEDILDYRYKEEKDLLSYVQINIKNGKFIDNYCIYKDENYSDKGINELIKVLKSLEVEDKSNILKDIIKAKNKGLILIYVAVIILVLYIVLIPLYVKG